MSEKETFCLDIVCSGEEDLEFIIRLLSLWEPARELITRTQLCTDEDTFVARIHTTQAPKLKKTIEEFPGIDQIKPFFELWYTEEEAKVTEYDFPTVLH